MNALSVLQRLIREEQEKYDREVEIGVTIRMDPGLQRVRLNQVMEVLDMDVNISTYALLMVRYRSVDAAVDFILEPEFCFYRHPFIAHRPKNDIDIE